MTDEDDLGRCSDPLRYVPVVQAAERAAARLEAQYDVRRVEGADVDPALSRGNTKVVRLIPTNAGAPITLALGNGDYAGVILRIGKLWTELFPSCGCDYCARPDDGPERVEHVVDALEDRLRSISEGTVSEGVAGDGQHFLRVQLDERRWWERRGNPSELGAATDIDVPEGGRWEPWTRRRRS